MKLPSAFLSLLLCVTTANALPVNQVDYSSLTGAEFISFEDVAGGPEPGTNYDGIVVSAGVRFGERFAGQTVSGALDAFVGSPSSPLTLLAGPPNRNLVVLDTDREAGGNILAGAGPLGFPSNGALGEGSMALLFSSDQSQFGFELVGGDRGSAIVSFYRRDGSLIDAVTLSGLGNIGYGFMRDGGIQDVAGITIANTDPGGIGMDNIVHDVDSVALIPEPQTYALLLVGLAAMLSLARRHRSATRPSAV